MTVKIDTDAEINSIRLKQQTSNPTGTSSGYDSLFVKNDGLYMVDGAGNVYSPHGGWIPTIGESWIPVSADAPSYVIGISGTVSDKYTPGMRIMLTQSTTQYGIITAVGAYTGTYLPITVYGGTDYSITGGVAITSPYYSRDKAPYGFPLNPLKWTTQLKDVTAVSQATPATGTWYNLGSLSLSVPIGIWRLSYQASPRHVDSTSSNWNMSITLSTANNSETDADFTVIMGGNAVLSLISTIHRTKVVSLAAKTSYYLNGITALANLDSINLLGINSPTIIRAECAYL